MAVVVGVGGGDGTSPKLGDGVRVGIGVGVGVGRGVGTGVREGERKGVGPGASIEDQKDADAGVRRGDGIESEEAMLLAASAQTFNIPVLPKRRQHTPLTITSTVTSYLLSARVR